MRTRRCILVLAFVSFLSGCPRQDKEPPFWDQVKITDLATKDQASTGLNTTDLDIHVFQVPTERFKGLRGLWDALNPKPFRYRNHNAFRSNAFRVAKGTLQQWDWIAGSLIEAGASKGATVSLWLSGNQEDDVTLTTLGSQQKVTFMDKEGQSQQVTIGPGRLVLRFKAEQGTAPQARQLVAYPVFTPSTGGAVPELAARLKTKDVAFLASAFSTPIQEGDIVVLGPEDYYGDSSTLGGLFFCDPQGRLTVDPGRPDPVRIKQAVRIYVIVCTRLSEESP